MAAWIGRAVGHGRAAVGSWNLRLVQALLAERDRWYLWLPVAVGFGISIYFALRVEPPTWLGPVVTCVIALVVIWHWRIARDEGLSGQRVVLVTLLALSAGFAAASLRTHYVAAPMLTRQAVHTIEGRIELVEERVKGHRLLIGAPVIERLAPDATPRRVRVTVRKGADDLVAGDRVTLRAMLLPPSPPRQPGGYDFARRSFFDGIGAVGFAFGEPTRLEHGRIDAFGIALARIRETIASDVRAAVPGASGAVAAALLTGLRGAIPDQVWRDMQAAGLAHLLAISGLHLGLVAGTIFLFARHLLALIPPLAVRIPAKKPAAMIALAGAFAYLLLAGSTIPTQRAFMMAAVALVAVVVDRNPLSMRLVACAALVVLLARPESLLGPSFQMSFAAVIGLVAAFEVVAAGRATRDSSPAWRVVLYIGGVALTTLIASLATSPLAAFHFNRLASYGIVANLLAVPVTAFWIMPSGLFGLILWPLGLAAPLFALMGKGVDVVLATASAVAALPGAAIDVAQMPLAALIVMVAGGLWLCLWQQPWRLAGLGLVALGLLIAAIDEPPDIIVNNRGDLLAVRLGNGKVAISPWRKNSFVTRSWLRSYGLAEGAPWPEPGTHTDERLRCDGLGCIYRSNGQTLAIARRAAAIDDDCARADLVLSFVPASRCPGAQPLIGSNELYRSDGLAFWIDGDGIRRRSVAEERGLRPWVR